MSDNKKYYYLRLKDNFFDSDELKILESMKDGYLYSNILLKLYLRSLKNDGKLVVNERIPYNAEMLASVTGHQVGTIKQALSMFKELGLIEVLENGAIYMLDIQNFIGKGSTEADRQRLYDRRISEERKQNKLTQSRNLEEICKKSTPEIEKELEIDKELYKEKDIDIDTLSLCEQKTLIHDVWENAFDLITANVKKSLDNLVDEYGAVITKQAILDAKKQGKSHIKYVEGVLKNKMLEENIPANNPKRKRFVKPTLSEIEQYCIERNNNVNAEQFYDYYESNGWKVGKNAMKDWKACVRTWERNGYDKPIKKKNNKQDALNDMRDLMNEYGGVNEQSNEPSTEDTGSTIDIEYRVER
ncbi:MAG: phage replisome organizer N-terminal domain-containing protein [Veillonella sp.]|uniref:phage replisome organizer N-terminal domain-containing protein n=1 Tax=Veillonella sp. TaxID=1926307 RepID=UPI00290DD266|nr:phage replisome organizer N-terminal domain-containing protein [Veillonella sp.]MDU3603027.1 phage replisome organizer N-terminal domain-containing protein [Veillonella sp.]